LRQLVKDSASQLLRSI